MLSSCRLLYVQYTIETVEEETGRWIIWEIRSSFHNRLCQACRHEHKFEKMRRELVNHKKKVWSLIEDERTLRSAIAHDIRTPVTLVKGNLEIIDEFFPHKLSEHHFTTF